jgi:hypothetical protein
MRKTTEFLVTFCIVSTLLAIVFGAGLYYIIGVAEDRDKTYKDAIENLENYWERAYEDLTHMWENAYENLAHMSYIENRAVNMSFLTSNGNRYVWSVPLDTVVGQAYLGWYKKQTGDFQYLNLFDNKTGKTHHVIDYRPFVTENIFKTVIPNLYHDLGNNSQTFVYEVWYVVTQLTTYQSEIGDTPRFPADTFAGGGGDCEDMAILIASMLKATPENYIIKLVYMDADNPTNPENINHATVWVETPSGYKTFVEGTSHAEMCPSTWANGVDGWYFEV